MTGAPLTWCECVCYAGYRVSTLFTRESRGMCGTYRISYTPEFSHNKVVVTLIPILVKWEYSYQLVLHFSEVYTCTVYSILWSSFD